MIVVAPPKDNGTTLIDTLLAQQSSLTAVESFSRWHEGPHSRAETYRRLLPASAPLSGEQYAFEVDLDKCTGCKACVTACHSLNGLDEEETWRSVGQLISTDWRAPATQIVTTACHHCVDPGCLNGCPVLAYDKDPATGIVKHLDDQCIGCQYCVMKCPYEVPQYLPRHGIVRKCDMCSSRLAVGEAPACVQACPNEAIRITVVESAKVRGKYRQLPSLSLQASTSSPVVNAFLPDSPNPAITVPTTRYVTQRALPTALEAADAREVRPAKAHPPLTFLLVLSQLGVGLALVGALTGGRSRVNAVAALVATLAAVIVGTLHLGQPLKAWRSFLGWRKSWFSRELIAFGVFLGAIAAHAVILHPLTSAVATLLGLIAVLCSAMIYVDTRRPFWNAPMTFGKFFGSVLTLGGVGALFVGAFSAVAFLALIFGVAVKLASENRIYQFLVDDQSPSLAALNKTALLLAGRFGLQSRIRVACALAGGIVLPALMVAGAVREQSRPAVAAMAFALCLAGELIERHLFFVAEVAPKMPGGGRT